MALSVVLARDLTVSWGGNVIAYANEASLDLSKSTVDVTTLSAAGWKNFLVDLKEWKISCSGLITRGSTVGSQVGHEQLMTSILTVDTTLTMAFKTAVTGDQYVTGSAYLIGLKASVGVGDAGKGTYEFQGTGALSTATV